MEERCSFAPVRKGAASLQLFDLKKARSLGAQIGFNGPEHPLAQGLHSSSGSPVDVPTLSAATTAGTKLAQVPEELRLQGESLRLPLQCLPAGHACPRLEVCAQGAAPKPRSQATVAAPWALVEGFRACVRTLVSVTSDTSGAREVGPPA